MTDIRDFADAIGRKKLADALGVGLTAISNAVVRGSFPSSWFLVIKSLADADGHDCPPDLFNMRPSASQIVDSPAPRQVHTAQKNRAVQV